MSSRTDTFLSLCLEQASKSTEMHFRDGCIIVRGVKIIGRGHNDFRPGYNGGSILKSGIAASGGRNARSPPIMASNAPLLQHAEIAGISRFVTCNLLSSFLVLNVHISTSSSAPGNNILQIETCRPYGVLTSDPTISALSLSGHVDSHASARSSQLLQKPQSCKLPGRSKRALRLRNLNSYVEAVCAGLHQGGKSQVQESRFESSPSQCSQEGRRRQQCGERDEEAEKDFEEQQQQEPS